ncbi:MAG: hypothetical protein AAF678_02750, partial [Pseudomonadota bacterium]
GLPRLKARASTWAFACFLYVISPNSGRTRLDLRAVFRRQKESPDRRSKAAIASVRYFYHSAFRGPDLS